MATKAQPFQSLLSGLQFDGVPASGYVVYFVDAGTGPSIASLKTIWLNANKADTAANPYTLDANGQAELYLDGNYDVVVKTAVGGTVKATWNVQLTLDAAAALNVETRDASAGPITIEPVPANDSAAVVRLIRVKRTDTSGNGVTIAPTGGTINGVSSITLEMGGESAMIVPIPEENDYLVM